MVASDIELNKELSNLVVGHCKQTVEGASEFPVDNLFDLVGSLNRDVGFQIIRNFYRHGVVDLVVRISDRNKVHQVATDLEECVHALLVEVSTVGLGKVETTESDLQVFAGRAYESKLSLELVMKITHLTLNFFEF